MIVCLVLSHSFQTQPKSVYTNYFFCFVITPNYICSNAFRLFWIFETENGIDDEEDKEDDDDNMCGICLEDMSEISPFTNEDRNETILNSLPDLEFPKLKWYPSRIFKALTQASKRASKWSVIYSVVTVVSVYIGGKKARYGLYLSSILLALKIYLEHWEETYVQN